jgi:hypothetical protein
MTIWIAAVYCALGRGQRRQGCVALNLGLEAVEIFKSELAEGVFLVQLSIPDKFGWLD